MKKVFSIMAILFLSTTVFATTITVKQDGTGDYATIQDAIDAAMPYDTVLVYPDTYYENVIIENKSLWLASLSLTTGDPSYRNTTIIDGTQNGACVAMLTTEVNTNDILHGFTIQNGSGRIYGYADWTEGGGVYVGEDISGHIENCIIKNNNSTNGGGGIFIWWNNACEIVDCIITGNRTEGHGGGINSAWNTIGLSGTSIYNNYAFGVGGGVAIGYQAICYFDSINLCSIYNNFSSWGTDFHNGTQSSIDLFVDTLTVLEPDTYFLSSIDPNGFQNYDITYSIQNAYLTPFDSDLYVNPISGNDQNSGLSPDEALKTIAFAYSKIAVDSLHTNTIHLSNGLYSNTTSGEKFPLNIRPFINIEGESMSGTILDGEYKPFLLKGNNEISNYKLSKMTVQRGNYVNYDDHFAQEQSLADLYWQRDNITLDSMTFKEGWSMNGFAHVGLWGGNNLKVSNCKFINNLGGAALGVTGDSIGDTCYINNCIFQGQRPDTNHPDPSRQSASALTLGGSHEAVSIATNCLLIDNEEFAFLALFGSHFIPEVHNNYLVNCTFADNSYENDGWMTTIDGSHNHFYNCIIYSEGPTQVILLQDYENLGKTHLDIYNSLVQTGEDAIYADAGTTYYYDTTTNIDDDPIFLGMWAHPYQIADGSPCINTGTLANLPDFIVLPETDLAGNPRIVGDSIDMGCYEWNPTIVGFNEIGPGSENEKPKLITASPNPFGSSTRISIKYKSEETVKVEIYDSFGHRVKTMLNSSLSEGNYELKWNGTDNNGNNLPKGVYFAIMFSGEKELDSLKIVKK